MPQFEVTPQSAFAPVAAATAERVTAFLRKVYGWMFVGLGVTASVAFAVAGSPTLVKAIYSNPIVFFGLIIAEFGLVFFLRRGSEALAGHGRGTLRRVLGAERPDALDDFPRLHGRSIASTFVVTAGMFGALALFGTVTKRSLAGVGQFAFMGLFGLILACLVGMFWHCAGLQFGISIIGVIVFTALTAWDAQRLKVWATTSPGRPDRLVRRGRCAVPLPRLRQPVPVPAAVHGEPATLSLARRAAPFFDRGPRTED